MSGLSALKLVYSKPVPKSNIREIRRQKLCNKLLQQLEMARCIKAGDSYMAVVSKRIKDDETGEFKCLKLVVSGSKQCTFPFSPTMPDNISA